MISIDSDVFPVDAVPRAQDYHIVAAAEQSPALWHEDFHTTDPAQARSFLYQAYDGGWRTEPGGPGSLTHSRYHARYLRLDEVTLTGRVRLVLCPKQVTVVASRGWLRWAGERNLKGPGEPIVVTPDRPYVLNLKDARLSVVTIDGQLLRRVAVERWMPPPDDIRFRNSLPRSAMDSQTLCRTMAFVSETFASSGMARRPLLVAAAVDAAAAAVLECYPTNVVTGTRSCPPPESRSDSLSRALTFIHHNAGNAIGVGDIADAVHLTPRAVQYLFRGRLATTPSEYLRRVRLHRAHQDLSACEASTTTVGDVASRWGFTHTGRFAMLYRQTFGVSPHVTLRG